MAEKMRMKEVLKEVDPQNDHSEKGASVPPVFQDKSWFETIFRNLSVGVILTDQQEKILAVNKTVSALLGYSETELVGQPHLKFTCPEDVNVGKDLFRSLVSGERESYVTERRYRRKDGSIIWGRLSVSLIREADQESAWYALIVCEDITDQKKIEKELKKERDHAQQYLDLAEVMFIALDIDGKVILANHKTCKVLGYSESEILGVNWCEKFLPKGIENNVQKVRETLIHGDDRQVEFYENPVLTRNGETRLIAWHNALLRNDSGQVIGSLSSGQDITERKRAEEAILESEQKYHALFENRHTVMLLIDPDNGRIVDANQAACSFYSYTRDELMRKKIMDINILSVEEIFIEMQKARLEERSCFYFRHQLADGKVVDVEVFNGPITIKGKGLLFSIIHDISQRKKAEKQIQAYQERLRSLSSELTLAEARERGRIASILHDNIGQDLALSLIKLGSVRREAYSAGMLKPLDEVAALIEKAIHDTQTLTFDLSFISLLKRFGYERAIAEWLEKHVQQGHGLKTHFKDDGREKPLGDDVRILLFEAVRELLVNVIKHAQAENIWIDIRKKDTHIEVDVKDDGVGMEVYDAEQFLPRFAGGGFGLFSIRERLNYIGGKLSIHSKKGLGTRVTLEAPLKLES